MCKFLKFAFFLFLINTFEFRNIPGYMQLTYMPVPDGYNFSETNKSHLDYPHVIKRCNNRDVICRSNETDVCAVRGSEFKDFVNACFLFFYNMCDSPDQEFYIAASGPCDQQVISRRFSDTAYTKTTKAEKNTTKITTKKSPTTTTTMKSLYTIDTAFDFHICPMSCPDEYSPVCVNVNRGFGLQFKYLMFINHCEADVYYCKNWEEFQPPEGEEAEMIQNSGLGWSYCGSAKYLQFARFSEVTASMGHYGWLSGDFKYSHIMNPKEKKPGYG